MIIWKGKGILIILYLFVTFLVVAISTGLLKDKFEFLKTVPMEVLFGFVLIIAGIWTKLTSNDYYINKEGRKVSLDIENELFFIKMSTWGLILPVIGIGLMIYGIIKLF